MSVRKLVIVALFAAASLLRLADAFRPINRASWRESDLGSIARNFVQEGMNPLYPRIDWRGKGPGYAEMELPLYPFLIAVSYELFGMHDEIGRLWAFLFSIGSLFFFYLLAREYLTVFTAAVAFAFFALNPLIVETATAVQPEALMLCSYLGAIYFFIRWLKEERDIDIGLATAVTALALLAKAPAAHIGLFFGVLLFEKYGWNAFRHVKIWAFGCLSILPAVLWYLHAKSLWSLYGNSLGVSNEYHWIGWDFLTNSDFLTGILRSEISYVWIVFGILAGIFGVWRGYREAPARHALLWLGSIFIFYLVAARTTSENWASYYHVFSIPPAALLFGFSVKKLWDYVDSFDHTFKRRKISAKISHGFVFSGVIVAIFATLLLEAKQVRAGFLERHADDPAFLCATRIKPSLQREGLIIASGGHCVDKDGYPLAYNASFMFYWLERRGWNLCIEDQALEKVQLLGANGAKYFVAQRSLMRQKAGFEEQLRKAFPVVAECDEFIVFDLTSGP